MTRRSAKPQSPHHILVFNEDWELLLTAYGPGSPKNLGVGKACQQIINRFCNQLRERTNEALSASGGGGEG